MLRHLKNYLFAACLFVFAAIFYYPKLAFAQEDNAATLSVEQTLPPQLHRPTYEAVFAATTAPVFATQMLSQESGNAGFAAIVRGGMRFTNLGWFAEIQLIDWLGYEGGDRANQASANFGLGFEAVYFNRHIRSAISAGMAVLIKEAVPDPEGTMGFYLDLIPAGYVFHPRNHLNLVFTPISLYIGIPSLKGIPLVVIQYRTSLTVEFSIW